MNKELPEAWEEFKEAVFKELKIKQVVEWFAKKLSKFDTPKNSE